MILGTPRRSASAKGVVQAGLASLCLCSFAVWAQILARSVSFRLEAARYLAQTSSFDAASDLEYASEMMMVSCIALIACVALTVRVATRSSRPGPGALSVLLVIGIQIIVVGEPVPIVIVPVVDSRIALLAAALCYGIAFTPRIRLDA